MSTLRVLLLGFAVFASSCGDAEVEQYEPPPARAPVTDFSFSTGVYPIVNELNCADQCHKQPIPISSLDLDVGVEQMYLNITSGGTSSYGETLVLELGKEETSLLLVHPTDDYPTEETETNHQKYYPESDPRFETILMWIKNGAQND